MICQQGFMVDKHWEHVMIHFHQFLCRGDVGRRADADGIRSASR
jgi:hypothetical protein